MKSKITLMVASIALFAFTLTACDKAPSQTSNTTEMTPVEANTPADSETTPAVEPVTDSALSQETTK